jgi:hypothetical protein
VSRSKKGIFLSQRKYVLDLLVEVGKLGAKSCSTPMVPNKHLTKDDGGPFDNLERYRILVRKLNYLAVITHPDIAFTVNSVSKFMSVPMIKHWRALEHILCYLKGTPELGILYGDHGYADMECFQMLIGLGLKLIEDPSRVIVFLLEETLYLGETKSKVLCPDPL